jgi:hypothetical protein
MRFLGRVSVCIVVLLFAIPPSIEATRRGDDRNDRNKDSYSRQSDKGRDNDKGRNDDKGRDNEKRYSSQNKGRDDDNGHKGQYTGKGHQDHGNGKGLGHDHHDQDPPISPFKPQKETRKYACSFGKSFGYACFCGRH